MLKVAYRQKLQVTFQTRARSDHNVYGTRVERVTIIFSVSRAGFPLNRIVFCIFKISITPQVEHIRHGIVLGT